MNTQNRLSVLMEGIAVSLMTGCSLNELNLSHNAFGNKGKNTFWLMICVDFDNENSLTHTQGMEHVASALNAEVPIARLLLADNKLVNIHNVSASCNTALTNWMCRAMQQVWRWAKHCTRTKARVNWCCPRTRSARKGGRRWPTGWLTMPRWKRWSWPTATWTASRWRRCVTLYLSALLCNWCVYCGVCWCRSHLRCIVVAVDSLTERFLFLFDFGIVGFTQ